MFILEEKLQDRRFTDLIRKAFKAGHCFNSFAPSEQASPDKGTDSLLGGYASRVRLSIVSLLYPMLVDIFLERLDNFMRSSRFMDKLANTYMSTLSRKYTHGSISNMLNISYVRYGDQLILGVVGSHLDCVNISNIIKNFFKQELFLELVNDSLKIINVKDKSAIFLGVEICVTKPSSTKLVSSSLPFNKNSIDLVAPIPYIKSILTKAGFLKDGKPVPRLNLTHYDKDDIMFIYHS